MEKRFKGVSASSGIAMGSVYFIGKEDFVIDKVKISLEDIPREILRFEDALINTRRSLIDLQKNIETKLGATHAQIFDAHLLVLEDRVLVEDVITQIKKEKVSVEYAFSKTIEKYVDTFSNMEDEYLKERVSDIKDVSRRVLEKLLKKEKSSISDIKGKVIIVAHDLSPADTAGLPKKNILGFITDIGGPTSHTAILARSLGISAVVGLELATKHIKTGDFLIVDGSEGVVIVNPSDATKNEYLKKQKQTIKHKKVYPSAFKKSPSQTKDGHKVMIASNIELPQEIDSVLDWGAEGIGLYRTEYMFLGRNNFPTEEEQYLAYVSVAKKMHPHPVVVRTLDLGGDKFLSKSDMPQEIHPFLGWRAIRFCLERTDVFKDQLRAILRASKSGNIKIMFPMISGIEEFRQAKKILEEAKRELDKRGCGYDDNVQVGAMIEVPSAALTSDILAKEADFFSIGTNDLIQYSLAVDRGNEKVAYLYEPAHPAVIKLIKLVVENAHKNNIWVGMCGEMASNPLYALLLLGLGLDEFSVIPYLIPKIKKIIRSVYLEQAQEIAEKVLSLTSSKDTEKLLTDFLLKEIKVDSEDILR